MGKIAKKSSGNDLSELPKINKGLYKFLVENSPSHLARMWLTDTRISDDGTVYTRAAIHSKNIKKHYDDLIKKYFESQGSTIANLNYVVHEGFRSKQMDIPLGDFCSGLENLAEEDSEMSHKPHGDINDKDYLFNSVVSRTEYPKYEGELFVHSGIKEAVRGIDLIVDGVLNENLKAKRYLILGDNSAGKTALASYAIKNFLSKKVSVSYVEVNKLVRWLNNSNGTGGSPSYVYAAYDANVIILDELGKICRADGKIHPGTQKRVRNILDHANEKNVPVIMLYTGDMNKYQKMLKNLQSRKGYGWGDDVARDLGSRLERKTSIWIKGLRDSDRSAFIEEYLKQEKIPENLNFGEVIRGIHDTLPSNAQIRQIIGHTDSVIFKARCNDGMIGYNEVVKLLKKSEQRTMLEKYGGVEDVLKKVANYTGVSVSDMKSVRQPPHIANARALASLILRRELGEDWADISGALNKTPGAMGIAVKKIDDVLALEEGELTSNQKKLRTLVENFESS